MANAIVGSGPPGKKRPFGSRYIDSRSGIEYTQTDSPSGSNWQPSITPEVFDAKNPNIESIEPSALIFKNFSFDNFSMGVLSTTSGDQNTANGHLGSAYGLDTTAGNKFFDFLVVPGSTYIIIPHVNAMDSFIVGGDATIIAPPRTDINLNIPVVSMFTGTTGTTGVTSGITSGTTSGITSGLTLYTAIEVESPISDRTVTEGKITDLSFGTGSFAVNVGTHAKGYASFAKNSNTKASGIASSSEGIQSQAIGNASNAGGVFSKATHTGEMSRSSNYFHNIGDCQYSVLNLNCTTTGATGSTGYTEVFINGVDERISIDPNTTYLLNIKALAVITTGHTGSTLVGESFAWDLLAQDIIKNKNGTLSHVGNSYPVQPNVKTDQNLIPTLNLTTTNNIIKIFGSGLHACSLRYNIVVEIIKIDFGSVAP